ncbi:MAG: exodeoxyribonuclease VII large subunit [Lentisphaeria bacterium]|jgi:exodeoxyribonuclease VII large subunit
MDLPLFDNPPPGPAAAAGRPPQILSVSELTRIVKELFEQTFYPFWVRGEAGNLTFHRSGHLYFTLKDAQSQIAAVWFRGAAAARQLGLAEGMEVEALGRLTMYEPRGQCQLVIDRLRPKGVGLLQQRFEELKRKLQAEGLFDPERKRPIPALPKCIGVVTSPEGAALQDFLKILGRRFASLHVRIVPVAVQGVRAAAEIAAGIALLNRSRGCDVIVATRGGGSLEDLWPFNEEVVARAVAASAIPVISAVGHEVDFTICDYVADLRAPTPSAAAELVVAKQSEFQERLANLRQRQRQALRLRLGDWRRRLDRAAHSPAFREPLHQVRRHQQRLDELGLRLNRALLARQQAARARLDRAGARLAALNPAAVLERGYAILLDRASGHAVTDAATAPLGGRLTGLLAKGRLDLLVAGRHPAG